MIVYDVPSVLKGKQCSSQQRVIIKDSALVVNFDPDSQKNKSNYSSECLIINQAKNQSDKTT